MAARLKCLFWNVEYLKSVTKKAPEVDLYDKADVIMLCESMCTEEEARETLQNYFVRTVGRDKDGCRGIIIASKVESTVTSQSANHMAVRIGRVLFVALYFTPDTQVADIILKLSEINSQRNKGEPALLCGDFNCRIDDGQGRQRGEDLEEALSDMEYQLLNDNSHTYIAPNGSSTIDLAFLAQAKPSTDARGTGLYLKAEVENLTVHHTHLRKHGQIRFELKVSKTRGSDTPRESRRVHLGRRLDPKSVEDSKRSGKLLDELQTRPLNTAVENITQIIQQATKERKTRKYKAWFDKDCVSKKRELLPLYRTRNRDERTRKEFNEKKRSYKQLCEEKRTSYESERLSRRLEEVGKKPWKAFSHHKGTGATQIDTDQLVQHFSTLANPNKARPLLPAHLVDDGAEEDNRPFTRYEVDRAILRTQNGKATGPDYLTNEVLKQSVEGLAEEWSTIFNRCLKERKIPDGWRQSFLKVLYKGKGNPRNPDAYRGISLLCSPLKILTHLINQRVTQRVENQLPGTQYGFRRNRSTRTPLAALLERGKRAKDKGGLYILFVDFKAAFPSVNRCFLVHKLKHQFGVDGNLLGIIVDLLKGSEFKIDNGVHLTLPIQENHGVPQGDSLSPTLFLCYVTDLAEDLSNTTSEVQHAFFADDLEVDSPDHTNIQWALHTLERWCDENEIQLNTSKTKVMRIRKGGPIPKNVAFTYKGSNIDIVNEYDYLGVTIQPTLTFTKHINKRKAKCYSAIGAVQNASKLSIESAMKAFAIKVQPIIEYGLKEISSFLTASQLEEIDKIKTTFLKRVLGVHISQPETHSP